MYSKTVINVQGNDQVVFEVYADETREQSIAFCFDEDHANIIAAAPELLSLVKDIVNASDNGEPYDDKELKEICFPIINMAEGENND